MEYPIIMAPEQLDDYLEKGWFRMRQAIFTTHYLQFKDHFYSALWLRVGLNDYQPDRKEIQLKKINSGFRVSVQPMTITEQHNDLFKLYRNSVSFDMASSLQELLLGYKTDSPFDSRTVNIYDGDKLIAAGFFDMGKRTAAGIACIYDPEYKKFSQGKYLIYLKMAYCREQGVDYFYPGYFVPGYKPFDYKLDIGKSTLEFLDTMINTWLPYNSYSKSNNPTEVMTACLSELQQALNTKKIPSIISNYRFFDAPLDPDFKMHLLIDVPVFLLCFPERQGGTFTIVTYDAVDKNYILLECNSLLQLLPREDNAAIFSSDLLIIQKELLKTDSFTAIEKALKPVKNKPL